MDQGLKMDKPILIAPRFLIVSITHVQTESPEFKNFPFIGVCVIN